MTDKNFTDARHLARIAAAVERLSLALHPNPKAEAPDKDLDAFVWQSRPPGFVAVQQVAGVSLELLRGIERQKKTLLQNSTRFLHGLPANNALLWGARGMGKSSLVKAVHGRLTARNPGALGLVEIHREDVAELPRLLDCLRDLERRFLIFCDDLSFEAEDVSYKSLKAALEGGIEGRPHNCLFYATSNRRHLLPRMEENDNAIHGKETAEEKISLSDRFGLWIGFHHCSQETYLDMVSGYAHHYALLSGEEQEREQIRRQALEWSMERGARSGRVAWQFIQDLGGRLGKPLQIPPLPPEAQSAQAEDPRA